MRLIDILIITAISIITPYFYLFVLCIRDDIEVKKNGSNSN